MSVEFDPVRLGQRRRRVEPAVVGVIVVTVAVVFALAKPWEGRTPSPGPPASVPAIAAGDATPTPAPRRTPRPTPGTPDWTNVANAVTKHESWGITAVLVVRRGSTGIPVSPLAPRYIERWAP